MGCIDLWLPTHTTYPLCRFSLLTTAKSSTQTFNIQVDITNFNNLSQNNEERQAMEFSKSRSARHLETTVLQNVSREVAISTHHIDVEGKKNVQNNQ
ncbi:RING-H2 finger protein ATL7 isoform X1 [Spatholobus suberectus]|nr:RING-H2 finger protein ATL7 isoform X1 [Spatholobus suberectus]